MTHACVPVVVNGQNCVQCPAVTAVVGSPARTVTTNVLGWDASARSVDTYAGDLYTQFSAPNVQGVVTGFGSVRRGSDPRDIPYGIYLYQSSGRSLFAVMESGVLKTTPIGRSVSDTYRIERIGTKILYYRNGRFVYQSATQSTGALMVITCMYASSDGVD